MKHWLMSIILLVCVAFISNDTNAISTIIGANVDNTMPPIAVCPPANFQLVLEASYTNNVGSIVDASGFMIDGDNQIGFMASETGAGTTGRIDKFNLNPFSAISSSGNIITSGANIVRPTLAINTALHRLGVAWENSNTTVVLQKMDYNFNNVDALLSFQGQFSQPSIGADSINVYFSFSNPFAVPSQTVTTAAYTWSGTTSSSVSTTSAGGPLSLAASNDGTLMYSVRCSAACVPVVDRFTTNPLTLVGTNSTPGISGEAGVALDSVNNVWYGDDIAALELIQFAIGGNTQIQHILNGTYAYTINRDAIQIDYTNNKIYYAWTNNANQLVVQRINRNTFATEQTTILKNAVVGTTVNVYGSVQLDTRHQRLYVVTNNGPNPQVQRISLCSSI